MASKAWLLVTQTTTIISSALLIASMLYQRQQVNIRNWRRNSQACGWITTQQQKNRDGFHPET